MKQLLITNFIRQITTLILLAGIYHLIDKGIAPVHTIILLFMVSGTSTLLINVLYSTIKILFLLIIIGILI